MTAPVRREVENLEQRKEVLAPAAKPPLGVSEENSAVQLVAERQARAEDAQNNSGSVAPPRQQLRAPTRKIIGESRGKVVQWDSGKGDSGKGDSGKGSSNITNSPAASAPLGTSALGTQVNVRAAALQAPADAGSALPQIVAIPPRELKAWPAFTWESIAAPFPSTIRAVATLAKRACDEAGRWPLSFARLMVKLPEKLSGADFALLLMETLLDEMLAAEDQDARDERRRSMLQSAIGNEWGDISARLESAHEVLNQIFFEQCPEMYRYWSNVLGGAGVEESTLIERYLVEGVDKSFQILLGRMLLLAFGAGHPYVDGIMAVSRWTINPSFRQSFSSGDRHGGTAVNDVG